MQCEKAITKLPQQSQCNHNAARSSAMPSTRTKTRAAQTVESDGAWSRPARHRWALFSVPKPHLPILDPPCSEVVSQPPLPDQQLFSVWTCKLVLTRELDRSCRTCLSSDAILSFETLPAWTIQLRHPRRSDHSVQMAALGNGEGSSPLKIDLNSISPGFSMLPHRRGELGIADFRIGTEADRESAIQISRPPTDSATNSSREPNHPPATIACILSISEDSRDSNLYHFIGAFHFIRAFHLIGAFYFILSIILINRSF